MPRTPLHALIWSEDRSVYELYTHGHLEGSFQSVDEEDWLIWVAAHTSFAFHGRSGHLNIHKEARSRGNRYWYAYHFSGRNTRKRYLGQTSNLTLVRLEQEALKLTTAPPREPVVSRPNASVPLYEQNVLLLESKLAHPRLPAVLVMRERLLKDLEVAVERHHLTLLSASAGWGKTTLLSAWASRHSHMVAWASLDELDNDHARFWVSFIGALRTCAPVGEVALAMLHSPQPTAITSILTTLLNDLASIAAQATPISPVVLVLDDYHVIEEQVIHEALAFFIERLPDHVHLVISSRVDPDFPLPRWRVRGYLAEIRAEDLRFTGVEAGSFLKQAMGYPLTEGDVQLLERRTEGWIAGLQLATLAMRQHEDRSDFIQEFTGSHRYILDYIQEEILNPQPLPVQRFLLQTAVLRRLDAAVCAALTDEPESQQMLEFLERNNLFVVPLDEQRQWYRVHDLFRDVLLARLHATQPELVPDLHQRAAHWYGAQGNWQEAIPHAMYAGDFFYAASMIERAAEGLWLNGEVKTLYRWIMALPDAVIPRHARLVLTAALYLLNSAASTTEAQQMRARIETLALMARVEIALQQREITTVDSDNREAFSSTEAAVLQRRLNLLHAWIIAFEATQKGDIKIMRESTRRLQAIEPDDEVLWQMIPLSETVILHFSFLREGAFMVPMLLEAKARVSRSGDLYSTIKVMQWLMMAHLQAGELRRAHEECLAGIDLVQRSGGHAILSGYFQLFLAEIYYFWNKSEEASGTLRDMLRDAQAWQHLDLQIVGYLVLVEVELVAQNLVGAQGALQDAKQLAQTQLSQSYQSGVAGAQAQIWLAQGNLAAASDWAAQVVFERDVWDPVRLEEFLMLVRVYLAQGSYSQARDTLERFSTSLDQSGDISLGIRYLALRIVALHGEGKAEQVLEAAARLFPMTEPDDCLRIYLDVGEPMRDALQGLLSNPHALDDARISTFIPFILKLLAAFEQELERKGRSALRSQSSSTSLLPQPEPLTPSTGKGRHLLAEPLTPREEEVLRLLMVGVSNHEIAAQLVISLATVKKHVSNILGKLGTESRTQAVARAREWSLLA